MGEAKVPIDHQRIFIGADIAKQAAEKGYLAVTFEQAGYGERLERNFQNKQIIELLILQIICCY